MLHPNYYPDLWVAKMSDMLLSTRVHKHDAWCMAEMFFRGAVQELYGRHSVGESFPTGQLKGET